MKQVQIQTIALISLSLSNIISAPAAAQTLNNESEQGGRLNECVNKAIADNPGPDFSKRYADIKKCQQEIPYTYKSDGVIADENDPLSAEGEAKLYSLLEKGELIIKNKLKDPNSAEIAWDGLFTKRQFKPSIFSRKINGYVGCGLVNAKNSYGGYVGKTRFVVIFKDINGVELFSSVDTGNTFDFTDAQCNNIPFPRIDPSRIKNNKIQEGGFNLADQLSKLAELHKSGALNDDDYERAKKRLIDGN